MEIEFSYKGKLYLLESVYDKSGIYAVAWMLSTDGGNKSKRIDETELAKVIWILIDGVPLRRIWPLVSVEMM